MVQPAFGLDAFEGSDYLPWHPLGPREPSDTAGVVNDVAAASPQCPSRLGSAGAMDTSTMADAAFGAGSPDWCRNSECRYSCDDDCPSDCGDSGHTVCCDDDACSSPGLCLDEACHGSIHPCDDEACLAETASVDPSSPGRAKDCMAESVQAAAAALASIGDNQLQVAHSAASSLKSPSPLPSPCFHDNSASIHELPRSLSCGTISMHPSFTDPAFASAMSQENLMNLHLALADHIMQHHQDPSGQSALTDCVVNGLSLHNRRCTFPRVSPGNHVAGASMAQHDISGQCDYMVADPMLYASHIYEDHGARQWQFSVGAQPLLGYSEANVQPDGYLGADRPYSLSPFPSASLPMGPSLTATPSTYLAPSCSPMQLNAHIATPPSLQPEPSLAAPRSLELRDSTTTPPSLQFEASTSPDEAYGKPGTATDDGHDMAAIVCKWVVGADGLICGQSFDSEEHLQRHCKDEHLRHLERGPDGFRCGWEDCTRTSGFPQKSKVDRHMVAHTGFKPETCPYCGLALSAKQALRQHIRTHTGDKPWSCTYIGCGQKFKQQSALTMHMRTHTGEKPLMCDICHKRFSESSNLSKHRRTHNPDGSVVCQVCNKDVHRVDQLRRHLVTKHPELYQQVDEMIAEAKRAAHELRAAKRRQARQAASELERLGGALSDMVRDGLVVPDMSPDCEVRRSQASPGTMDMAWPARRDGGEGAADV